MFEPILYSSSPKILGYSIELYILLWVFWLIFIDTLLLCFLLFLLLLMIHLIFTPSPITFLFLENYLSLHLFWLITFLDRLFLAASFFFLLPLWMYHVTLFCPAKFLLKNCLIGGVSPVCNCFLSLVALKFSLSLDLRF